MKKLEKWEEGKLLQEKILAILDENVSDTLYKNREDFLKVLKPLFKNVPEVKADCGKQSIWGYRNVMKRQRYVKTLKEK